MRSVKPLFPLLTVGRTIDHHVTGMTTRWQNALQVQHDCMLRMELLTRSGLQRLDTNAAFAGNCPTLPLLLQNLDSEPGTWVLHFAGRYARQKRAKTELNSIRSCIQNKANARTCLFRRHLGSCNRIRMALMKECSIGSPQLNGHIL